MKLRRRLVLLGMAVVVLAAGVIGGLYAYHALTPPTEYCRLVFGPESQTSVLLKLYRWKLYVYRSGSLEEAGVRLDPNHEGRFLFDVTEPDGTQHEVRVLRSATIELDGSRLDYFSVDVKVKRRFWEYDIIPPSTDPSEAEASHFNGPLLLQSRTKEWIRDRSKEIVAVIGSGVEREKLRPAVVDCERDFPKDMHPVAELEFPSRDSTQPPIKVTAELKERC